MVTLKATSTMLMFLISGWLLPLPVALLLAATVWVVAFLYYRKQWHSPTPEEFSDLEHVDFAVPARDQEDSHKPISVTEGASRLKEFVR